MIYKQTEKYLFFLFDTCKDFQRFEKNTKLIVTIFLKNKKKIILNGIENCDF